MSKLPLYRHRNGQWAKKISGKVYYFGTDLSSALASYERSRQSLIAGLGKLVEQPGYKLHELCDLYYDRQKRRMAQGDLNKKTLDAAEHTLRRMCDIMGRESSLDLWNSTHILTLKEALYRPIPRKPGCQGRVVSVRSHTTVAGDIIRINAFLNWCHSAGLSKSLKVPAPSARTLRLEKSQRGPLEAAEIRAVIAHCSQYFLPVVMLGINGGMGAADIARLRRDQLHELPWLYCPRNKTGAPRKLFLWPETIEAIRAVLELRSGERAFYTVYGGLWVNGDKNPVVQAWAGAAQAGGVQRGTFYDLRRTFQTIGDGTLDFPAVSYCMGHTPKASDMSARYRSISDERVKTVCLHVRDWLYG